MVLKGSSFGQSEMPLSVFSPSPLALVCEFCRIMQGYTNVERAMISLLNCRRVCSSVYARPSLFRALMIPQQWMAQGIRSKTHWRGKVSAVLTATKSFSSSSHSSYSEVVEAAREYYNSPAADSFYSTVWGGEDLHVGIYDNTSSIREAARATVQLMASKIDHLAHANAALLDIGAGYGGASRALAQHYGFNVCCLNISETQNERNRAHCEHEGITDRVAVFDGDFENIPFPSSSFDVVWCIDSILHSGNRKTVFEEVDRVLKPRGEFLFSDPMQQSGVRKADIQPVLDRIHLDSMGSIEDYQHYASSLGWEELEVQEMSHCLVQHYSAVRDNLMNRKEEFDAEFMQRMLSGLQHWIEAGEKGAITWGVLHFAKPEY